MKTRIPPGMGPGTAGELSGPPTTAPLSKEPRTDPFATVRSGPPGRSIPPSPSEGFEVANVSVGRGEPPEHVFRRLLGAYLAGAREFSVRERPGLSAGTRDVVRSFCRRTRQPDPARPAARPDGAARARISPRGRRQLVPPPVRGGRLLGAPG